jgi:beta-N-acetylhexosaminidase
VLRCLGMAGEQPPSELSRRDLLRALGFASVAVGLAACGTSATASPKSSGRSSPGTSPRASTATLSSPAASAGSVVPSSLSLRQKIGQLLVVGFRGQKASKTSPLGRAIAAGQLGGVILFDRNIASAAQLGDLTAGLAELAPRQWPLIVAVDQEGGQVTRLGPAHGFPAVPSQASVGRRDDAAYATQVYDRVAATLAANGINLNLAPVVDLNVNRSNPAIGALERSFSADADVVSEMARACVQAHHSRGVLTTLKHFPGIGSASGNTDSAPVDVSKTWTEGELVPFRDLVGSGDADIVMVGHTFNTNLDPKYPASLSRATVATLLRGDLGWDGPVITDDLQAVAITRRVKRADAIAFALDAGADLLLFGSPTTSEPDLAKPLVEAIVKLVDSGRIKEARIDLSVARIAHLRGAL